MIHTEQHPLAGKTVKLKLRGTHPQISNPDEKEYRLEDWWDRVANKSWMFCKGNPACLHYGVRSGLNGLPLDDDVVYGKVGAFGHLLHASELGEVVEKLTS